MHPNVPDFIILLCPMPDNFTDEGERMPCSIILESFVLICRLGASLIWGEASAFVIGLFLLGQRSAIAECLVGEIWRLGLISSEEIRHWKYTYCCYDIHTIVFSRKATFKQIYFQSGWDLPITDLNWVIPENIRIFHTAVNPIPYPPSDILAHFTNARSI
jgi:hypothetical protein